MYSVVILTLNEEQNLPHCLASVSTCDDVVVLDSGSTDRTIDIARAVGARVVVHPFANFAQQRNHAHTGVLWRHEWVFHLDADESMTPELHHECCRYVATHDATRFDGCYVAPKMIFRGRWIPHCTDYPAYQARFVHAARFRFVQSGHGQREAPESRMGHLHEAYMHNLSAQSETALAAKHATYARSEAVAFLRSQSNGSELRAALLGSNPLLRRRAMKELSYHLPFRGAMRFLYQYLFRGGFLDGRPGLAYCRILARYEQTIAREIRRLRLNA